MSRVWSGMRGGRSSRSGSFLRRRMVPIILAVVVIGVLFFITTGASLPDDGEPIAISTDDALALATKVADAAGDAPGTKSVDLTVTDREVTSFLSIASFFSSGLEDLGGNGDLSDLPILGSSLPDSGDVSVEGWSDLVASQEGLGTVLTRGLDLRVTIRDPEVRFTSGGEIIIRGYGKLAFLQVPARIVVVPSVDDGRVDFDLVEGQFGRLPLPGGVANLVADGIEHALFAGHSIASIEEISVSEGSMRFVGQLNR